MTSPLIIGSGLAGMATALQLAAKQVPCVLVSRGPLGGFSSSAWAQGGIAAAVGAHDHPDIHAADTIKAGAGLCDSAIVKLVCDAAPVAIRQLEAWGVEFDRDASGYRLGLEGAHSRRRILHIKGDGSGAAIVKALAAQVRQSALITVMEGEVVGLAAGGGVCIKELNSSYDPRSVRVSAPNPAFVQASSIILATGGAGALWQHTTNPVSSWGQGLALALQLGAELRDLEFMQFHPTALDIGRDPMPLLSEALRGEGAMLVDEGGNLLLAIALAPRDLLSRVVARILGEGRRAYLDCRMISDFAKRFPGITSICQKARLDPARDLLPVRPAAHYHMGGVAVDADGCTSVPGLFAVGEVACNRLHGANRLASNSLLEAVVMAARVADAVAKKPEIPVPNSFAINYINNPSPLFEYIREFADTHLGILRNPEGLKFALGRMQGIRNYSATADIFCRIAEAALARQESIGAHYWSEELNYKDSSQ